MNIWKIFFAAVWTVAAMLGLLGTISSGADTQAILWGCAGVLFLWGGVIALVFGPNWDNF